MSLREETDTWDTSTWMILILLGTASTAALIATLGAHAWAAATGVKDLTWNPAAIILGLANGDIDTTNGIYTWIGITAGIILALSMAIYIAISRTRGTKKRGDEAAKHTGRRADIQPLSSKAAQAKADRLGIVSHHGHAVGLPIGKTIADTMPLWSSFEDVCLTIAGPRTGKTTSWVVPRIYAAPGAVVATSNKRDIVDITRQRRGELGTVWVFDPQGIATEPQTWWWNPLTYVTNAVQAQALTTIFVDAQRQPGATTNAFFDDAARDLVAAMLLAAARANLPITALHRWLNNQADETPVDILQSSGDTMVAQSLEGVMNLVAETRSGVYGGAAQIMSFLLNDEAMKWVTPQDLPQFQPETFVTTSHTLYCLSQEGRGSASPIVTALTVAVVEAAIAYAKTQHGGRLATPMLIELDEAANVCRWRELPDQYSHFGSRGICVDTVLQSWSQGATVWTEAGMKKLWSASNVKVYGGGVSEKDFLTLVSDLIGPYFQDSINISNSRTGRSVSTTKASQQRPIATVADLQALPSGRAWVFASGTKAVLIQLIPYWTTNVQPTRRKAR